MNNEHEKAEQWPLLGESYGQNLWNKKAMRLIARNRLRELIIRIKQNPWKTIFLITLIVVLARYWSEFLCFGRSYPWLVQGLITGAVINLLIFWLQTADSRRNSKNLAGLIITELLDNYNGVIIAEAGGTLYDWDFERKTWDRVKYDMARFFEYDTFYYIDYTYDLLAKLKTFPSETIVERCAEAKVVVPNSIKLLNKITGSPFKLPKEEEVIAFYKERIMPR